jgi:uncharacterized membrane protein YuzA (DUF378 family)
MSMRPPPTIRTRPTTGGGGGGSASLGALTNPNRTFGLLFGAVYVLVGIVGFFVTTHVAFAATTGKPLIFFNLNPLHNLVHIAVGLLFLGGAAAGEIWSARVNALVGAVYLLVGIAGLFVIGHSLNILALNGADNGLHFASAVLALGVGAYGISRANKAKAGALA